MYLKSVSWSFVHSTHRCLQIFWYFTIESLSIPQRPFGNIAYLFFVCSDYQFPFFFHYLLIACSIIYSVSSLYPSKILLEKDVKVASRVILVLTRENPSVLARENSYYVCLQILARHSIFLEIKELNCK